MSEAEPHENPLIPNRRLRQMYVAMVEARVLDEFATKAGGKTRRRFVSTRGEEACRVSTSIDLMPGDLISDSSPGVVMDLLSGVPVGALLRRLKTQQISTTGEGSRQLPWVQDAGERLRLALGVALAFKKQKSAHLVVAYVRRGDLGKGEWRRVLELAATLELPLFFVVLPGDEDRKDRKKEQKSRLLQQAHSCKVPGLVVDTYDAVALYRVTQEAFGRIRGGGGPVLMECIAYQQEGRRVAAQTDAVLEMRRFLLGRKVASPAWLESAGDGLRKRIAAAGAKA